MDQHQTLFHYLLYVRDRPGERDMIRRLEAEQVRRQNAREARRAALRGVTSRIARPRTVRQRGYWRVDQTAVGESLGSSVSSTRR